MGLIRVLIFALVAVIAYLMFHRLFTPRHRGPAPSEDDERLGRLVQDPQCGVYVDAREAVSRKVPDGLLFFCSKACADTYLDKSRPGA